MVINDLETPAVLIDCDRMERNIARMQAHCDSLGIAFRPHIKTHKTPEIARLQIQAGAVGIACQKVSEAEVFADAGFDDIQIPYNIVGPQKTARLAALAAKCRVSVSVDDVVVIDGLAEAAQAAQVEINVLVDLETDLKRTGTLPENVVKLARQIDAAAHLHFAGVLVYPSHPANRPALLEALDMLKQAGLPAEIVSGGGTPAAAYAHEVPELTELRVGTYVFNDWNHVQAGVVTLDDCAMHVLATVVSHAVPERMILDCGSKTLAADSRDGLYGHIVEYPQARIYRLSEEHAHVDVSACPTHPRIGQRVHVVPVHTCVVSNLADRLYGVRGDQVEVVWPIAARGRVW
jgi:D-serine deaminase-like pyridoxal phosphate-dependent protein